MAETMESLREPRATWGDELRNYEREKRRIVDEGLIQGPPNRLPRGQVQSQERCFDPVLQRFRNLDIESKERLMEERERVAHLNRAQDVAIMRETPFHIINHESRLEKLAPGADPTRISGGKTVGCKPRTKDTGGCYVGTAVDYNIVSNLPFQEHHWARPGERPYAKERSPQVRRVFPVNVKDFNIISNRYLEGHSELQQRDERAGLLEATQKHMTQNRFDPVTQTFVDPLHEVRAQACEVARVQEGRLRAEALLPPGVRGRQSTCYDIVSNKEHDKEMLKVWDEAERARRHRPMNSVQFEHNLHMQDIQGDHVAECRARNKVAPERFEAMVNRGYDIIDNRDFGTRPKEKQPFLSETQSRQSAWDKIQHGRAVEAAAASSYGSAGGSASQGAPPSRPRQLSASSSAPQLRRVPTYGDGGFGVTSGPNAPAPVSSERRRSSTRLEATLGAPPEPAFMPSAPGRTAPPPPRIPGSPGGSVYSRQKL